MRTFTFVTMAFVLAACSNGGSQDATPPGDATIDDATSDVSSDAIGDTITDVASDAISPPPHVEIRDGSLRIDGVPTFLYGGDLHYFRVRDPNMDAAKTKAMWSSTMDTMRAAGMNLVTTYAPWDWHATSDGVFDFGGARDLGAFLQLACDKKMWVVLKPGPLITGEWPRGFGTYGAIPEWWKQAHVDSLVKKANGDVYSYSPTGDTSQRQPIYLDPTYLASVKDWYAHVFEVAKPFLGKCLVGVQVDNETNGYWGERFGDVDYSAISVDFYRKWLATRYASIADLNAAYGGTTYASFDAVSPPTSAPGNGDKSKNKWFADWYEAGEAYSHEYLSRLRAMIEALGFAEPDILFLTNDSPFALTADDILIHNVLLHDGPTKETIGVAGLDLYPKQSPTNDHLQDQPFQADYFTKLYTVQGGRDFAWAAELQGGFYSLPVIGHPDVRPQATDELLARTIGHGLKGGSFYVVRDGINADNSDYAYLAPIAKDGTTTARYDVIARWGAFLASDAQSILGAHEITNAIAIVTNARYQSPQGGILDDLQRFSTIEMPAIYGWLANAGFDPEVVEARGASIGSLAKYKVVFYANPDFVDAPTANLLADYAKNGGVLVDLLWPGRNDDTFHPLSTLASLYPGKDAGFWVWVDTSRAGQINAKYGTFDGQLTSVWYESFWSLGGTTGTSPFAWERTNPFGANGNVVGYVTNDSNGKRAFLGTSVWTRFNQDDYYGLSSSEIANASSLASWLVALSGESPIVTAEGTRHLAWARRSGDVLYVFVVNDGAATTVRVDLVDEARLGLQTSTRYHVVEALGGETIVDATGSALASNGISVVMQTESTAVLRITPQ